MKIIRLGQTLCDGSGLPPIPIPSTNLELFLRHNFNQYATEDASGTPVSPPYSSNASTMPIANPISSWVDATSGSSIQAEQTTFADRPTYGGGTASFSGVEYFDMDTTINLTDALYTFVIQRNSTGYLSMFVNGGDASGQYSDKAWGVTTNQDTDTMAISNIGATADDTQNMDGQIRSVVIYSTDHNATERQQVYNYI